MEERQHNEPKEKDQNPENSTQKTKDRVTHIPLKTGVNFGRVKSFSSSCSIPDSRRVTVKQHDHQVIYKSCWMPVYIH